MWYVYILLCSDNSLYTGISDDPEKRLQTHQAGKGGKYTRSHPPLKIIYRETFATKSDSLKREAQIKKLSKAKKLQLIPKP